MTPPKIFESVIPLDPDLVIKTQLWWDPVANLAPGAPLPRVLRPCHAGILLVTEIASRDSPDIFCQTIAIGIQ